MSKYPTNKTELDKIESSEDSSYKNIPMCFIVTGANVSG